MNRYAFGQSIRLSATITPLDSITEPVTATFQLEAPDGAEGSPIPAQVVGSVTYPTSGPITFAADVDPDLSGTWRYRFMCTGGAKAAGEGAFYVTASPFGSP